MLCEPLHKSVHPTYGRISPLGMLRSGGEDVHRAQQDKQRLKMGTENRHINREIGGPTMCSMCREGKYTRGENSSGDSSHGGMICVLT
jgi:hypothetical protein